MLNGIGVVTALVFCTGAIPAVALCEEPQAGLRFEVGAGPIFQHRFDGLVGTGIDNGVDALGAQVNLSLSIPVRNQLSFQVAVSGTRFGGGDPHFRCFDCYHLAHVYGMAADVGIRVGVELGGLNLFASVGPRYAFEHASYSGGFSGQGTSNILHGFGGALQAGLGTPTTCDVIVGGSLLAHADQNKVGGGVGLFLGFW